MDVLKPETIVVRHGHRPERDKRVTSHVLLVARAFGASGFVLLGNCDPSVSKTALETQYYWGKGLIFYSCGTGIRGVVETLKNNGYRLVHLTMYGAPLNQVLDKLEKEKRLAVIVGAEKVPRELYEVSDYNVSVGNQPHSEVAALAVFLDRLYNGRELYRKLEGAKLSIEPSHKGKRIKRALTE